MPKFPEAPKKKKRKKVINYPITKIIIIPYTTNRMT